MIKLIEQRHFLRRNLLTFLGFSLSIYFSWHVVAGERSYLRYHYLQQDVASVSSAYEELSTQRETLEVRVVKLRPHSIDRDLLEERVHAVLGYAGTEDHVILYGG